MRQAMRRATFYLPETMIRDLAEAHHLTGAPVSEHVRRAVAMYLEVLRGRQEDQQKAGDEQEGIEVQDR